MEELFLKHVQLMGLKMEDRKVFMAGAMAVLTYLNEEVAPMEAEDASDEFEKLLKESIELSNGN